MGALSVVNLTAGCSDKGTDTSAEPPSETGGPDEPIEEGGTTADGRL